ncbi:MAG: TetR/AcrR family transcriptional regulator [Pseudomonadota bacterium]
MIAKLTETDRQTGREALVRIATGLLVEHGPNRLTLRALADAAAMSRSTPYSYFRDKQDILDGIRAAGYRRLTARYETVLEAEPDPLTRLRRCSEAYVAFAMDEPAVFDLMTGKALDRERAAAELNAARDRFIGVAGTVLQTCLDAGLVTGNAVHVRVITVAALHGLIHLVRARHIDPETELRAHLARMLNMIARSILNRDHPDIRANPELMRLLA